MLETFISLGVINFLVVISPGPDFAMVVKNTLGYSRKAGMFTALGVGSAVLVHTTYCLSGLAAILAHSRIALVIISGFGGPYLLWMGFKTLRSPFQTEFALQKDSIRKELRPWSGFQQGFLTNILNPKAIIFFIAIFSTLITTKISLISGILIASEIFIIVTGWFLTLSWMLTHPLLYKRLYKFFPFAIKLLGGILILFGASVVYELIKLL